MTRTLRKGTTDLESTEDVVTNVEETGKEIVEAVDIVVYTTTDGHMAGVPTNVTTA